MQLREDHFQSAVSVYDHKPMCYHLSPFVSPCVCVCVCFVRKDVLQQQHYCSQLASYSSFLPSFSLGCGQQTETAPSCSPFVEVTRGGVRDDDWWVKNRTGGYKTPTSQPAPGAMLRCATRCLTSVPLLTTPLKMTNALVCCFPRLATVIWCS